MHKRMFEIRDTQLQHFYTTGKAFGYTFRDTQILVTAATAFAQED